jgi:DNA polymerase-4
MSRPTFVSYGRVDVHDRADRQILHVDMDAFYASVEQRDDPSLRGRPVVVGGRSMRSVVCPASYEARPFGVRSAMPMVEAMRRCPDAIVVPPRMAHYADVSSDIMAILRRYTPLIEALSLDEAFLDVTHSRALFGEGREIAERIRADIEKETQLTASAGVATSKFVAKVASDLKKPNGVTEVPRGEEARFLAPLPVERMWGIGPAAAEKLRRAGLRTIGDLARTDARRLGSLVGSSWGEVVASLAKGIDARDVVPDRAAVSVGAEETYETDLRGREEIVRALLSQATRVARRLTASRLVARTITLKLKLPDFTLVTRRSTLPEPIADTTTVHRVACELLEKLDPASLRVRLTGISASGLVAERDEQATLFPDAAIARRRKLERTLLDVRARFGEDAVMPAGLADALPKGTDSPARRPPR